MGDRLMSNKSKVMLSLLAIQLVALGCLVGYGVDPLTSTISVGMVVPISLINIWWDDSE